MLLLAARSGTRRPGRASVCTSVTRGCLVSEKQLSPPDSQGVPNWMILCTGLRNQKQGFEEEKAQDKAQDTRLLQARVDSCNSGSERGTNQTIPATDSSAPKQHSEETGETVRRWRMVKIPCQASSQQLCIPAGCPGPSQRRSNLHCHPLSTIQN
ncbi:hypothetical protein QTO34_010194 [Cnephaeus nilssonii]|uniref:Uncharacterized protein n=1 Tax=Cnephaeus nilssonii TaxID=3371016 RepID=A0AA40HEW8_CNENI|nr:hypothetical protein QTO34_010194 [Eptesicus nilssonii]